MKIAFIGDSYCADINKDFTAAETKERPSFPSWLELITQKYNADVISKGEDGLALFYAYETLLEIIDEADYIILCITKEFRLPNMHRVAITPTHHSKKVIGKKLSIAATHYYEHLISLDFHILVHGLLIKEMDRLMLEKKKKCIWFFVGSYHPAFDYQSYMNGITSGPVGSHMLGDISAYELYLSGVTDLDNYYLKHVNAEWSNRLNHLGADDNQSMAKLIIDLIDSNNFIPRLICMDLYF